MTYFFIQRYKTSFYAENKIKTNGGINLKEKIIVPSRRSFIISAASVTGQKEKRGPIGDSFDLSGDDRFGKDTWEKAEAEMQRLALGIAIKKAGLTADNIDVLFAGDLINQCISSSYGLSEYMIPFLGLFGACSTCAEGLLMASVYSTYYRRCGAVTSSHYCSAERQFRFPLEYGGQRSPTAQWTVTGSGAFIVSTETYDALHFDGDFIPEIVELLPGRIIDRGINDANQMGAAMAPAAIDTLTRYFESGRNPEDFDMIATGDLGYDGSGILCDLLMSSGVNITINHSDCGLIIFDRGSSDTHAGGSGCGCSATVLASNILPNIKNGTLRDILFIGTGALMNTMSLNQGQTIPGIAHLVRIRATPKSEINKGEVNIV